MHLSIFFSCVFSVCILYFSFHFPFHSQLLSANGASWHSGRPVYGHAAPLHGGQCHVDKGVKSVHVYQLTLPCVPVWPFNVPCHLRTITVHTTITVWSHMWPWLWCDYIAPWLCTAGVNKLNANCFCFTICYSLLRFPNLPQVAVICMLGFGLQFLFLFQY